MTDEQNPEADKQDYKLDGYAIKLDDKRQVFVGASRSHPGSYAIRFTNAENEISDVYLLLSREAMLALQVLYEQVRPEAQALTIEPTTVIFECTLTDGEKWEVNHVDNVTRVVPSREEDPA